MQYKSMEYIEIRVLISPRKMYTSSTEIQIHYKFIYVFLRLKLYIYFFHRNPNTILQVYIRIIQIKTLTLFVSLPVSNFPFKIRQNSAVQIRKETSTIRKLESNNFIKDRIWHTHLHTQMEQRLHLSEFCLNPTNKNTNNSTQLECIYRYSILFQSQYTQTQARSTNKNSLWYKLTVEASRTSYYCVEGDATDDPTSRVIH